MNFRVPLVLFVLAALAGGAHGQESAARRPQRDKELWLSVSVETKPFKKPSGRIYEKKFIKNFRSQLELGYRSDENLTASKLFYTVLGARYRAGDHFKFGFEYRYNARESTSRNSSRIDLQGEFTQAIGRLDLSYRLAGQHEFLPVQSFRDIIRNRIEVELNTRKFPLDPHASAELFNLLHYTGDRPIGIRYEVGAKWRISKYHKVDLSVRHDRETGIVDPRYRVIFAASYEYEWRR